MYLRGGMLLCLICLMYLRGGMLLCLICLMYLRGGMLLCLICLMYLRGGMLLCLICLMYLRGGLLLCLICLLYLRGGMLLCLICLMYLRGGMLLCLICLMYLRGGMLLCLICLMYLRGGMLLCLICLMYLRGGMLLCLICLMHLRGGMLLPSRTNFQPWVLISNQSDLNLWHKRPQTASGNGKLSRYKCFACYITSHGTGYLADCYHSRPVACFHITCREMRNQYNNNIRYLKKMRRADVFVEIDKAYSDFSSLYSYVWTHLTTAMTSRGCLV